MAAERPLEPPEMRANDTGPVHSLEQNFRGLRYEDTRRPETSNGVTPKHSAQSLGSGARRYSFFRRRSTISEDVRKDSGLAASVPANGRNPTANGQSENGNTAPSVPSITLNESPKLSNPRRSSKSGSFSSPRRGKRKESTDASSRPTSPSSVEPFRGIMTDIPTGGFDDPFSIDSLQFSKRGSVLYRGKRPPGTWTGSGTKAGVGGDMSRPSINKAVRSSSSQETDRSDRFLDSSLASDERRHSKRLRSMYEAGSEGSSERQDRPLSPMPEITINEEVEPPPAVNGILSSAQRSQSSLAQEEPQTSHRSPSAMSSYSSIRQREPFEVAGGMEDWQEVDPRDVDRFGFIRDTRQSHSKRTSLLNSSVTGSPERRGPYGPSTLGVVDEDPSKPSSRPQSPAPGSRLSVLPHRGKKSRASPSLLSARSKASSASSMTSFRSGRSSRYGRGRRWLDDAGDMLGLHPAVGMQEEETPAQANARRLLESKRCAKWEKMAIPVRSAPGSTTNLGKQVVGAGQSFTFDTSSRKLIARTWKGIPDRWRATAWYDFLARSSTRFGQRTGVPQPTDAALVARYHELQELYCADDAQIDMDVPRTIGGHVMFKRRYRGGQRLLFRLLRALSLYFPHTGYVQGMAPVAATLLCYFEEEKAFVCGARMWMLRGVGWLYGGQDESETLGTTPNTDEDAGKRESAVSTSFEGLMLALDDFEKHWLDPPIGKALNDLGIAPTSFGTKWYLTLFSYSMPFHAMVRVWDVFLLLSEPVPLPPAGAAVNGEKAQHVGALPKADLAPLHAVTSAILHGLADVLGVGADKAKGAEAVPPEFENVMTQLTREMKQINEEKLMRVAKGEWEQARKRGLTGVPGRQLKG